MKLLLQFTSFLIAGAFVLTGCKQKATSNAPVSLLEASKACPEWAQNANIYEVNIRQYTPEGTFNAFASHLPRLKEMGVDILWLMPIYPISEARRKGSLGSYYAVSDYTSVNPKFGTMEDFGNLVKFIHELDMKVVLDWVPNHTGWSHHWITEHPDYYTHDAKGNIVDPIDPETGKSWGWTDVADLNYDNQEMRKEMIADMLFWLNNYKVDGFRHDVASAVPDDFWQQAVDSLRKVKADIFMLAEAEYPPHRNLELFAMNYGWSFHHLMNDIAQGKKNAHAIDTLLQVNLAENKKGYYMQFITNHDENSWNGTEYERMGNAVDAMAVLAFTFDGMPLIYSGQEAGMNKRLAFFEKDTIQWGTIPKQGFYKTLLDLKHHNKALWNGTAGGPLKRLKTTNDQAIYAFYREKEGQRVVVILNLSDQPQQFVLEAGEITGRYNDIFGKQVIELKTRNKENMDSWTYQILERGSN